MSDDPKFVRQKLLEHAPRGSRVSDVNAFLAQITTDVVRPDGTYRDGLCKKSAAEISCSLPIKEEWWGNLRTGFDLRFMFDNSGRLSDAHVSPWSVWFSKST